jgi:hypothetical protein
LKGATADSGVGTPEESYVKACQIINIWIDRALANIAAEFMTYSLIFIFLEP